MEKTMQKFIDQIKVLLINEADLDEIELIYEAKSLHERYSRYLEKLLDQDIFECDGEKELEGLYKKLERLHEINPRAYSRDDMSHLACKLDFGSGFDDEMQPVDDNELPLIQREITRFITNRERTDPYNDDPEFADILIKQRPSTQITNDDMMHLASYLQQLTHSFVSYIAHYRPEGWHWAVDTIMLSQYVFEHSAEATYKIITGTEADNLSYNIRHAFTYHEPDVPSWLKKALNESVTTLEEVVTDTISYINQHDYHKLDYEAWLRPVLYNIGLGGIIFTLEQTPKNDGIDSPESDGQEQ